MTHLLPHQLLLLFAPGLLLAQPSFYCDYACDGKQSSAGCREKYCAPTDDAGCPLVPAAGPLFESAADCAAFAAKHPSCHPGGSCYVPSGRPSFPSALSDGFAMTGTRITTQWQFGVRSVQLANLSTAADFASGLAKVSTILESLHQVVHIDTLVRGPENRIYTNTQTSSGQNQCYYQALNDTMIKKFVEGTALDFTNSSWLEDLEVHGVFMHLLAIPELYAQIVIGGETPPSPRGGGALLFVRASDLRPMWTTSSIEWAEDDWDANGGLQAEESRTNFSSFTYGKPQADFNVPSSWGDCQELPPPNAFSEAVMRHQLSAALTERSSRSSMLVQV